MTLGAFPIASEALLADATVSSSGTGSLAGLGGYGSQGTVEFRGERFWAAETKFRFAARDTDGDEMLGVTDKAPEERVWYEVDFLDILRGASILSLAMGGTGSFNVLDQELVSNGETTHLARVLVSGVGQGETSLLRFDVTCSDGSIRKRTLKIRGREL